MTPEQFLEVLREQAFDRSTRMQVRGTLATIKILKANDSGCIVEINGEKCMLAIGDKVILKC